MLPLDDVNRVLLKDVKNAVFFTNYTHKFINDIINSLVSSKLLKVSNDYLILTKEATFNTNPIDVFFNISDYADIWEQNRKDELVLSRQEIICANINQLLKNKPLSKSELFETICNLVNVFEVDNNIFDKSIDYMCKMDYIKLNNDLYEKIVYL